jgi:hypothetical protein
MVLEKLEKIEAMGKESSTNLCGALILKWAINTTGEIND